MSSSAADQPATGWAEGPPPETVAELLRTLELTISRHLDGVLHGNYQGLTPGHGSEPGESRVYQPGDDVRRIDWNVTARTNETHVRELIADHDLTAWLVVDTSATMQFGTVVNDKASTALAAAASIGFLSARNQNRVGAVLVAGPAIHVVPPRAGKNQVRAILATLASPPESEGAGRADLAGALDRAGALARRRGFVAVISDFAGDDWSTALGRLSLRHDLLAITVHDPREYDVPPIGLVQLTDPATGRTREVRVTRAIQERFAAEAARERETRLANLGRTGADTIELTTDSDWLGAIALHVQRRRTQAVRGGVLKR
ncbi:MAG: DUF58 domain-containing protein [Ilumatobacter sp.]|nr:DUF58 domain-containing protein [Ilumatobacter sp.]